MQNAISIIFIDDSIMKCVLPMIEMEHYIMEKGLSILANTIPMLLFTNFMKEKENFYHVNRKLHHRNYNPHDVNRKLHYRNYDFHDRNHDLHDRTIKLHDGSIKLHDGSIKLPLPKKT
jgi:hypothetical protein